MLCRFSILGAFLVASLSAGLVGCSGAPPKAVVKGKVSIGGKNLTTGSVIFYAVNNNASASATINENGEYVMNDAPVGDVKITVSVPKAPPGGIEKMMGVAGMKSKAFKDGKSVDPESGKSISIMGSMPTNIVPIPDKYANAESSGLTYTVTRGEQTKDLPLTP